MFMKIGILILNKLTELDITLFGGTFSWNIGTIALMVVGGMGSNILKEKFKEE
ncbi:hypothetical protein D3C84_1160830 [compost metagenome]